MNVNSFLDFVLGLLPASMSIAVPPEGFSFTLAGHTIKVASPAISVTISKS